MQQSYSVKMVYYDAADFKWVKNNLTVSIPKGAEAGALLQLVVDLLGEAGEPEVGARAGEELAQVLEHAQQRRAVRAQDRAERRRRGPRARAAPRHEAFRRARARDEVDAHAERDALQRSLAQSKAKIHAALERTDVLRRQLGAAASERATAVAVATAEAKAYADSQMQQELRRFQALLEQHRLFSGVRSP